MYLAHWRPTRGSGGRAGLRTRSHATPPGAARACLACDEAGRRAAVAPGGAAAADDDDDDDDAAGPRSRPAVGW
eukprot:scaffold2195_cov430-Prasinococcus_capsulatus_cf.AAC.10